MSPRAHPRQREKQEQRWEVSQAWPAEGGTQPGQDRARRKGSLGPEGRPQLCVPGGGREHRKISSCWGQCAWARGGHRWRRSWER